MISHFPVRRIMLAGAVGRLARRCAKRSRYAPDRPLERRVRPELTAWAQCRYRWNGPPVVPFAVALRTFVASIAR